MRKTCLLLLLAPLVILPAAAIRRGSVIPNTIYRPSQTSGVVADTRSGTVIDQEAGRNGNDLHARRFITLDEEDEDEEEMMSYGSLAHAGDVYAHLDRIHRAVGKVFPQTERTHKPMQRVDNLSEVQSSNSQRDPKNRVQLLYLGIDPTAQVDDETSYEVVSPMGFQFSKIVGIVVPRTERELQRQVAYMTGRYSQETRETAATGSDHYQMTGEMRDTIRIARNGVIGKLFLIFFVGESLGCSNDSVDNSKVRRYDKGALGRDGGAQEADGSP